MELVGRWMDELIDGHHCILEVTGIPEGVSFILQQDTIVLRDLLVKVRQQRILQFPKTSFFSWGINP